MLASVLRSRRLRRLELAFVLFALGEFGVWLAVMVYAYQHGGTTTAALIATLQLVPAAVAAPLIAGLTDRRGGPRMLLAGYALQALAVGATAATILFGGPRALAYAGAVVATTAVTITRPAQIATLAGLVETPDELTAANVLNAWADSGALLAGPALAGVLIAVDGPGLAMAGFAAGLVMATWLIARLRAPSQPASALTAPADRAAELGAAGPSDRTASPKRMPEWARGTGMAVLGVLAAEYIALGALDVLVVVLAVRTLHLGASFAGYLDACFGLGSVLGAATAVRLVGASSLARPLLGAAIAWAVAYAILGIAPTLATGIALLCLAGVAHRTVDTAGRSLLARVTPLSRVGRVFGLLEGMTTAALAVGALLVPLLYAVGGIALTLIAIGALIIASVGLSLAPMRVVDQAAPAVDGLRRLHRHPLFRRLSLPALEDLARDLVVHRTVPGERVVVEGEPGDRFYLIAQGQMDVSIAGRHVRTLGEGDGFGEIALLRDVPRTATVAALGDGLLYGLGRRPFLNAMGTEPPSVQGLPGHAEFRAAPAAGATTRS